MINFFPNDVHDPYNPASGAEKDFSSITNNVEQQKFLATLRELDNQIGRFLSELNKMGKLKNTLILFTSDNGPTDWPRYYKNEGGLHAAPVIFVEENGACMRGGVSSTSGINKLLKKMQDNTPTFNPSIILFLLKSAVIL